MRHFDRITLSSFINFNDMNLHLNFNDPNYEFALAGALLHYRSTALCTLENRLVVDEGCVAHLRWPMFYRSARSTASRGGRAWRGGVLVSVIVIFLDCIY